MDLRSEESKGLDNDGIGSGCNWGLSTISLDKYTDRSLGRSEKWSSRSWEIGWSVWSDGRSGAWSDVRPLTRGTDLECGSSIGKGGALGVQIWDNGSEGEWNVEEGMDWKGKMDSWKTTSLDIKILLECKLSSLYPFTAKG